MIPPSASTQTRPTRRRFIAISAAMAGVGALPGATLASNPAPVATWRGLALGAGASITLAGLDQAQAAPLFEAVTAELTRLEDIFSLFRANSALSRLNRDGELAAPPAEMLEILSLANALNTHTGGAFDPTVQPLWTLYAKAAVRGQTPDAAQITAARARTGWRFVRYDAARIALARPGMGLTLNGIAQGYITDRIAGLLRTAGLQNVLVDMGEIRALGQRPGGGAWRVGLADPAGGVLDRPVSLSGRALATSAPGATVLDAAGRIGHIFDPRTGQPGGVWRQVSVSADRAALADGLATASCLLERAQIAQAVAGFPAARLERLVV
jgi:FAD:protein FMN transferase